MYSWFCWSRVFFFFSSSCSYWILFSRNYKYSFCLSRDYCAAFLLSSRFFSIFSMNNKIHIKISISEPSLLHLCLFPFWKLSAIYIYFTSSYFYYIRELRDRLIDEEIFFLWGVTHPTRQVASRWGQYLETDPYSFLVSWLI